MKEEEGAIFSRRGPTSGKFKEHSLFPAFSPGSFSPGSLFSYPILSLPVSLFPPDGSCSSLLPAAHTPVLSDSTERSQDELLPVTHTPHCSDAVWEPWKPLLSAWKARSSRRPSPPAKIYHCASIFSGIPLNSLLGDMQTMK